MKVLMFAGSLRKESLNKKLLGVTKGYLESRCDIQLVDLNTFQIPLFNQDLEASQFPEGIRTLGEIYKNADAVVISTPEYNGSISGVLKNTIDWLSRLKPHPFSKKPTLLLGASPGHFGAIRGLWTAKATLDNLGSYVYPKVFALSEADKMIASEARLAEPHNNNLINTLEEFLSFATDLKREKK